LIKFLKLSLNYICILFKRQVDILSFIYRIFYKYKIMPFILKRLLVRQKNNVIHKIKSWHSRHSNLSLLNMNLEKKIIGGSCRLPLKTNH